MRSGGRGRRIVISSRIALGPGLRHFPIRTRSKGRAITVASL
jgi:hypothetical protein